MWTASKLRGHSLVLLNKTQQGLLGQDLIDWKVTMCFISRREEHLTRMTTISEDADDDSEDEELEFSTMGNKVRLEFYPISLYLAARPDLCFSVPLRRDNENLNKKRTALHTPQPQMIHELIRVLWRLAMTQTPLVTCLPISRCPL